MNLEKLFKAQQVLRNKINYNEPDRFEKLVLALLVEIGECANEHRASFKFWSKDQEPRTKVPVTAWGAPYKNPLLEEYVDGLHFILELGLELKFYIERDSGQYTSSNITQQFIFVQRDVSELYKSVHEEWDEEDSYGAFDELVMGYIGLGKMLGFTEKQIEKAYFDKNAINHSRQENGY